MAPSEVRADGPGDAPLSRARSGARFERLLETLTASHREKTVKLIHRAMSLIATVIGTAFAAIWLSLGLRWSALAGAAFALCGLASLLVQLATAVPMSRTIKVFAYSAISCCLAAHYFFGGGPGSAGMMAACYPGTLLLLVADPSHCKACLTLAAVVLYGLALAALEQAVGPALTPQRAALPRAWHAVFLALNVNVSGAVSFCIVLLNVFQLQRSQQALHASKAEVEALNRRLTQQQEKLELEGATTRRLIANVFPESVSQALVGLIGQCSGGVEGGAAGGGAGPAPVLPLEDVEDDAAGAVIPEVVVVGPAYPVGPVPDRRPPPRGPYLPRLASFGARSPRSPAAPCASSASPRRAASSPSLSPRSPRRMSPRQVHPRDDGSRTPDAADDGCDARSWIGEDPAEQVLEALGPGVKLQPRALFRLVDQALAPRLHFCATILFADLVGFTAGASRVDPKALVRFLDRYFGDVDDLCRAAKVEKIKTIGDCYMCVGWTADLANPRASAGNVLSVARRMHSVAQRVPLDGHQLSLRAGMCLSRRGSGEGPRGCAGVVGLRDAWGGGGV